MTASLLFLLCSCLQCRETPVHENTDYENYASEARAMLDAARDFLWSQQGSSGGWHSQTHGILKGGQALTPFVLSALLDTDPANAASHRVESDRALDFLRRHIDQNGVLGVANPRVMEYPNYATAYALRVLSQYGDTGDESTIEAMQRYLVEQQFDASRGIEASHPAFGGWGFGERGLVPGSAGYVDLSHTRRVLQTLRLIGITDSIIYNQARAFLDRLQKRDGESAAYDGGFYYSPVVFLANKGGVSDSLSLSENPAFRSYATATCDGILALLAAGFGQDDPSVADARAWLEQHPVLAYPQGIPQDDPARWDLVMRLYHLAVRAEVYHALGWPEGAMQEIVRLLAAFRRDDGSFSNPHGEANKEDDPLLATALALSTLHFIVQDQPMPE